MAKENEPVVGQLDEQLEELKREKGFEESSETALSGELIRDFVRLPQWDRVKIRTDPKTGIVEVEGHMKKTPKWIVMIGVGFAALTAVSLFLLVIGYLPVQNKFALNAWISLCIAGSLSFIGGTAAAEGKLPLPAAWGTPDPVKFSVAGGIAAFVILLLLCSILNR